MSAINDRVKEAFNKSIAGEVAILIVDNGEMSSAQIMGIFDSAKKAEDAIPEAIRVFYDDYEIEVTEDDFTISLVELNNVECLIDCVIETC